MVRKNYRNILAVTAAVLVLGGAVAFTGCAKEADTTCTQKQTTAAAVQPVGPNGQAYLRQFNLAFEGGTAVIGLYDEEAVREFAERQPLSIPLQRLPDRIIITPALPDTVFGRTDGTAITLGCWRYYYEYRHERNSPLLPRRRVCVSWDSLRPRHFGPRSLIPERWHL